MLFEKQKDDKGKGTNASIVGVSDVVLSGMAAQCLECTLSLVKLLGTNIESHEFTRWWDNISCKLTDRPDFYRLRSRFRPLYMCNHYIDGQELQLPGRSDI